MDGKKAREFASGLTAGGATTLLMHPLDLIKVRLQVSKKTNHRHPSLQIIKQALFSPQGGILEIYRGIGPNLLGNTISWGLYFMLYRQLVDRFVQQPDTTQYMACAMTAGTTTSLLTNPIWVLKTRMLATSRSTKGAYRSMYQGAIQIMNRDGLRGFWRGFGPGLLGVFQASIQFSLYERIKMYQRQKSGQVDLGAAEYIGVSAISKCIAAVTMYPYQVVRSRCQVTLTKQQVSKICRSVCRNEGVLGFYKGLVMNLVRVVPATCITFVVYEKMSVWLDPAKIS